MTQFITGLELQKPILTLSIGDIMDLAAEKGLRLTDEELIKIFDELDETDPIIDAFWTMIEVKLEEYQ
jgi:hypothetical protein